MHHTIYKHILLLSVLYCLYLLLLTLSLKLAYGRINLSFLIISCCRVVVNNNNNNNKGG